MVGDASLARDYHEGMWKSLKRVGANRAAIDVVLRYHSEQGLTKRRFAIEDVFFPGLLDT